MEETSKLKFRLDLTQQRSLDKFVQLYNEVDRLLTSKAHEKMRQKASLSERASERLAGTLGEKYIGELKDLHSLRNILIHGPKHGIPTLAVPTEDAIERLGEMVDFLKKRFVAVDYAVSEVITCTTSYPFEDVLRLISDNDFSQIPVLQDGKIKGLFTSSGVTRWISQALSSGESLQMIKRAPVSKILPQDEARKNYVIFGKLVTLDTVLQKFKGNRVLAAVLITENGLPDGKLKGIITPWDIGRITESLLVKS